MISLMTDDLSFIILDADSLCPAVLLPEVMSYRKLRSHPSIVERDSWLQLPLSVCLCF